MEFPHSFEIAFPNLKQIALQVTLPSNIREDHQISKNSNTSALTFKDAYAFKAGTGQNLHRAKSLLGPDIPPFKSLFIWRLSHNKVPTDENLTNRGFSIPSMCSICKSNSETSGHLFFQCPFAINMWAWFASIIKPSALISSIDEI